MIETYQDQILRQIRKYSKGTPWNPQTTNDRLACKYYSERLSGVACASWEVFKESWAGQLWIKRNVPTVVCDQRK